MCQVLIVVHKFGSMFGFDEFAIVLQFVLFKTMPSIWIIFSCYRFPALNFPIILLLLHRLTNYTCMILTSY